jgi:uncharacterized delta-60 repeat protein
MKKKQMAQSAFFRLCISFGFVVFFAGVILALFAAADPQSTRGHTGGMSGQVYRTNAAPAGGVYAAWVATYNGGAAQAIAVDDLGNVYVTGESGGYVTITYDSAGQQQWVARYSGPLSSGQARAIAVDNSGNVYVTGESTGIGTAEDYATVKYNSAGQQQWVARYNGPGNFTDAAYAIAIDGSGNVYVTGQSDSGGQGSNYDYVTIKYNSDGQQQWLDRYDGPGNDGDAAYAMAIDGSGNVYVTGVSVGSDTGADFATIKYNSARQQQWVTRHNGPANGDDYGFAIAIDSSGNLYVTGSSRGPGTDFDYATVKYNSAGQQQWATRYTGPEGNFGEAKAIAVDGSGNVYVTGHSPGAGTADDYATIKYNSAGQQQWVARYNGPGNGVDEAHAIALDSSGNVYVTGQSYGAGNTDYATIKYDSTGQEEWVIRYDGPGNPFDFAFAMAVDESANVYVTGQSNNDYTTIKYVQGPRLRPLHRRRPLQRQVLHQRQRLRPLQLRQQVLQSHRHHLSQRALPSVHPLQPLRLLLLRRHPALLHRHPVQLLLPPQRHQQARLRRLQPHPHHLISAAHRLLRQRLLPAQPVLLLDPGRHQLHAQSHIHPHQLLLARRLPRPRQALHPE